MDKDFKFDRAHKAILWVIRMLNELEEEGIVEGRAYEISEEFDVDELLEGFEPTPQEIDSVIQMLRAEGTLVLADKDLQVPEGETIQ